MHAIYELKEKLCKELEGYGERGELSASILDTVDKLAHAIKNLDKIIEAYEMQEEEASYRNSYDGSYERGGSYEGSYRGGRNSYDRGGSYEGRRSYEDGSYRRGRGRNARRDSRGRYSSEGGYSRANDDMVMQLREMMEEAPDQQTRQEIERLVKKMEQQ